jgi:hypothetical protein
MSIETQSRTALSCSYNEGSVKVQIADHTLKV